MKILPLIAIALMLSACSSPPSRYQHKQDFAPSPKAVQAYSEPVPRSEPLSISGNPKSYKVFGKRYQVMSDATGFSEQGEASWYGMKFHGHKTANGETYDVHQFTAAHKTLPIPSYVKVTRLDTGKSVIVRVNDRGPFHKKRIIDLSYAAAVKLGIHHSGVAQVKIDVLQPPTKETERWLQVGAFKNKQSALALQDKLRHHLGDNGYPITVTEHQGIHKVRVGPIPEGQALEQTATKLQDLKLEMVRLGAHQLR